MEIDPYTLIGKAVPAADGGDYGHLIVDYDPSVDRFLTLPIFWSSGALRFPDQNGPASIDRFKASYRYMLNRAR